MSLLLLHTRKSGLVRADLEAYYDLQKNNLLRYSEEIENAVWGTGPVTANLEISPRGDVTADGVADQSAAATQVYLQAVPIVSSTDAYTFSVYVKKDDDESRFPEIRIQPAGGVTEPLTAGQINTKTGASAVRTGAGSISVSDEGSYWRVAVTETDNGSGNSEVRCSIVPAYSVTLGGAEDVTLTGSIVVWGGQLNTGASPVTYEQTTDNQAVVDRSGRGQDGHLGPSTFEDVNDPMWRTHRLNFDAANDFVLTPAAVTQNAEALTLQIIFKKTPGTAVTVDRTLFGHNGGGSYIRFFTDTTIGFWLSASVTSALVQGPAGAIPDDGLWKMMTFRWQAGVVQDQLLNLDTLLAADTATPASGVFDSTYRAIGQYASGNYFDGEVATTLYYRRYLTDDEVARNYRAVKAGLAGRGIMLP